MNKSRIVVLKNTILIPDITTGVSAITFEGLKASVKSGKILKLLWRFNDATLLTYSINLISKPLITAVLLRLLSRKTCWIEDEAGNRQNITLMFLSKLALRFGKDIWRKRALFRRLKNDLRYIEHASRIPSPKRKIKIADIPLYIRSDIAFGIRSGGSIGHIAGVLNNLDSFTGKPIFVTTDTIPGVRKDIEVHVVQPKDALWDFQELPSLYSNTGLFSQAEALLTDKALSFVYQRYSLNNYAGLKLSKRHNIPFVLEYNGSEVWISQNWGSSLKYLAISERIESLNLGNADLIIVVSEASKDQLLSVGVEDEKILVNPNGVDPEEYSPEVDGQDIRKKYDLHEKIVIGFIGTFGRWHGAEVLAKAFGKLLTQNPEHRTMLRLLMIGDGATMAEVRDYLSKDGVSEASILTGIIPQADGPSHLAACDILVSPHVPNADGTRFFGSPTKLFEYMAMGKGIVASDLDQIGEVLEHNKTAWLVEPGDVNALVDGLKVLIEDRALRERLGKAAREEVVAKYTWKEHTRKIIDALQNILGVAKQQ